MFKKSIMAAAGFLTLLGITQVSEAQNFGSCVAVSRNGAQTVYELRGNFENTSASFGTDYGGHNFNQRNVMCNGQWAYIPGLQINPGNPGVAYVTVVSSNGNYVAGCRIDVSQHWQTTSYFCD